MHTLAFWREKQGGAEHRLTLKARLSEIWKVLCRLYVTDGELLDSQGKGTGIYVEIRLSGCSQGQRRTVEPPGCAYREL